MNVLIGTPIHETKDYAMKRWLGNVSKLTHPANLFMIDNSHNTHYVEKVKTYCSQYNITNYTISHIELSPEQEVYERVARSREIIRQKILLDNYDSWFSWECDQLIPVSTLDELIRIMNITGSEIIEHNSWGRGVHIPNCDWGVALIHRKALRKYQFLPEHESDASIPDGWISGESWFRNRVVQGGGSVIDVYGVIDPIQHLDT